MSVTARLVASLEAPLDRAAADAPYVLRWPGRRLLVQQGDAEAVAYDLDGLTAGTGGAAPVRFPAPWRRRLGPCAVSPERDLAVFSGTHALRAVDAGGRVRWEIRHGCWSARCRELHASAGEYDGRRDHRYPDRGSAVFSADGSLVWAHVRTPLASDGPDAEAREEWLVVDAADGRVLGRADTRTAVHGSVHVPHPDPRRMGLTLGEGQDGVPLYWGRWDGEKLTAERVGDDIRVLLDVSPSGDRFLTVTHYQEILAVHRTGDHSVLAELDAAPAVPRHPGTGPEDGGEDGYGEDDEYEPGWDYEGGFLDEDTAVAGTAETDDEWGPARHWAIDLTRMRVLGQVAYPERVFGSPRPLGDGTWYTLSEAGDVLRVWARA
ncbi:hypothetical protein GCM10010420_27260 [Streptomyces glaucosporus]|uniref:Uncharacterized protein n=1 Tax=Streptomyces glaucosporus TaxID=284044 RepID=A0ABP5VC65_9ACTN